MMEKSVVIRNRLVIEMENRDSQCPGRGRDRRISAIELPLEVLNGNRRACTNFPTVFLNALNCLQSFLPEFERVQKSQLNLAFFPEATFAGPEGSAKSRLQRLDLLFEGSIQFQVGRSFRLLSRVSVTALREGGKEQGLPIAPAHAAREPAGDGRRPALRGLRDRV